MSQRNQHGKYECRGCGSYDQFRAGARTVKACHQCADITQWDRVEDRESPREKVPAQTLEQAVDRVAVSRNVNCRRKHLLKTVDGEIVTPCNSSPENPTEWRAIDTNKLNASFKWCRHCRHIAATNPEFDV